MSIVFWRLKLLRAEHVFITFFSLFTLFNVSYHNRRDESSVATAGYFIHRNFLCTMSLGSSLEGSNVHLKLNMVEI